MNYLRADESMRELLRTAVEPMEVRDYEGELLGYYTPLVGAKEAALYEKVKALFDPAEIKRRKERSRSEKGYTLEQVMERLRAIENGK